MSNFELRLSVFPQTAEDHKRMMKDRYDETKKYPGYGGTLQIPASQVQPLIEYLSQCNPDYDEFSKEDVIPLRAAGYMNTAKTSGKKYLNIQIRADWKKKQEIEERRSSQPPSSPAPTSNVPVVAEEDSFAF